MGSGRTFARKLVKEIDGRTHPRQVIVLAAIAIMFNSLLFADSIRRALVYQVEFTYGEAGTLYLAQHSETLYGSMSDAPYIISFYTPLYYLVVGTLTDVFGHPFLVGRTVAVGAAFGAGGLVAKTTSVLDSRSKLAPATAAALFVFSPIVARKFAVYGRVDTLGILFSVAAIYWFVSRTGYTRIVGCVGLCLLAGLTKQSLIAAPVAILIAIIWKREWKDALLFIASGGIVAGAVAFLLVYITDGRAITHLLVYNRAAGFFLEWGAKQYLRLFVIYAPLGAAVLCTGWWVRDEIPPVVGAYTLVGTLVAAVLLFRRGAALNHTFEALAGATMMVGGVVGKETPRPTVWLRGKGESLDPLVSVVLLLVILQLGLYGFLGAFVATAPSPAPAEIATANVISDADGPVISSDVGIIVRSGVETDLNDPEFTHYLLNRGLWDNDGFVRRIDQQRYSYIVLEIDASDPPSDTFWTDTELEAIRSHYQQVQQRAGYRIYAPES